MTADMDGWVETAKAITQQCGRYLGEGFTLRDRWIRYDVHHATPSSIKLQIIARENQQFESELSLYTMTSTHRDFAICTITLIDLNPAMWRFRIHGLPGNNVAITGCADLNERPRYAASWWSRDVVEKPCDLCQRTNAKVARGYAIDNTPLDIYRCNICQWVPCGLNARIR